MFKKNLISFLTFLLVWLLFGYGIGIFHHFRKPPMSVHQGAQCDRASLAQNYYYNGFNFFYPEVNETRCMDGIVSCELPFTNYLAACLYKVFGYDEFWFRLLSYLLVSMGMYALFLWFRLYLNGLTSFLLTLLINSSPIILFYSVNFLPDISSLGMMLLAWYLFFRIHIPHPYLPTFKTFPPQLLMILCLGIGIASKTTSFVQWMTMFLILLLSSIRNLNIKILDKRKLSITLVCSLIVPVSWYMWSMHLSQTHNNEYFMMEIPDYPTIEGYWDAWHVYLANWPQQTFSEPLFYLAGCLFLVVIVLKRFISPALWFLSVINLLGSVAFLSIMIKQFRYHDYYVICLFPSFVLCWIALAEASKLIKPKYWWFKLTCFILVCLALKYQFRLGRINLEERYTPGNYWEQSHLNTDDYRVFRQQLNALGIDRTHCVAAGTDNGPNNMLYLLHLRGQRFFVDHAEDLLSGFIYKFRPLYLISNDSAFTEKVRPMVKSLELKTSYKNLHAYRIIY